MASSLSSKQLSTSPENLTCISEKHLNVLFASLALPFWPDFCVRMAGENPASFFGGCVSQTDTWRMSWFWFH